MTAQMNKMLEVTQLILEKVSFDRKLFRKELLKAMRWLNPSDRTILLAWCLTHFALYREVILEVFHTAVSKS